MDRTKFIDDLIDAGASDDEIAEALSLAEERGEFATQQQQPEQTQQQPESIRQEPNKDAGLGGYWTEDLPNAGKQIVDATMQRARRIEAPTVLGAAAQRATGTTGFLGDLVEGTAGIPERAARTVAGAAGTIGEVAGQGANLAYKSANRLTGGLLDKATEPAKQFVSGLVEKPVRKISEWYNSLSEAEKANYGSAVDILELLGIGTGAKAGVKAAKSSAVTTGKTLKGIDKAIGKISQETSGVSEEALRMAGTKAGREALKNSANKQYEIGKKLVDMVDNAEDYMPEREIVNNALDNMPPINLKNVLQEIDNAKVIEGSPSAIAANKRLDELKNIYTKVAAEKPVNAKNYRELRKQLDYEIQSAFNKDPGEASIFEKQAMKIRNAMKKELEKAAEASGNPEYVDAMKNWHDKINKLDKLKSFLGKNATTRGNRAESFVANLFNKNKTQQQKILKDISDVFGNDFNAEAKLTYLANELGPEGKASWLPRWTTGRSLWAKGLGMATGSPAIASRITLPLSGKIGAIGEKLEGLGRKKINVSNFDDVDWDRLKLAPDDIRQPLPESRQLPAPMVGGEAKYDPMLPSVGDRVRAIGRFDKDIPFPERQMLPSPEEIKELYPHLSKEDIRPMQYQFNERRALPAPMVGEGAQQIDPMLPTMGERLKSIGTGEQPRFKAPETSSMPKKEPFSFDIQAASKEFVTLPQLKAATKKILQEVPLTTDEKERLVDFMRYINGLNENTSDWPLRIEKYKRRTSKRYNIDPDLGNRRLGR